MDSKWKLSSIFLGFNGSDMANALGNFAPAPVSTATVYGSSGQVRGSNISVSAP